jgi:major vault protein
MSSEQAVIRIKPNYYVHILDNNTNVTRVEAGPQTFTRQDHEKVVAGPEPMIMIPPRNFCVIANPVQRDKNGKIIFDKNGQVKLRHGDEEIRFEQEPFSLYPGEKLVGKVSPLQVVAPDTGLRLKALRDFKDENGLHKAGDEWLFRGPNTYIPRVEVQIVELVKATVLRPNQALKLRARRDCKDYMERPHRTGEEWLVRDVGAYLVDVDEEVVSTVNSVVLTEKKALHLRATRTFTDIFGKKRRAGEEWLITFKDTESYIPDVDEVVVGEVALTSLNNRQFCIVVDPVKDGKPTLGKKELRIGECSFFLQPGETLEGGIQSVYILGEDEALLLKARENFEERVGKKTFSRKAGELWMVSGPLDYFPPVEVEVVEKRRTIPLDENEGIYVRDMTTGKVRAITGESYMLKPNEELWSKELPSVVEELLAKVHETGEERDKTRVVTFRVPHNCAVQLYDYKEKKSRVVFGPELVMLGPDEQFSVLDLSGSTPKKPHVVKDIALRLGPDFMSDVVVVETADHARLSLKMSYNWFFDVDRNDVSSASKIFSVKDFVGDTCKAVAGRIRGTIAAVNFDKFHRNSAKIIRSAVFGQDENGKVNNTFRFLENNLVLTNLDIQSVEPVDQRTRDSLQKSVQLAIEITTKAQEASARHESSRLEQEAMGRLERQKISDTAEAERSRKQLLELQSESAVVEAMGQATAEAKAKAQTLEIEANTNVKQAELQAQALGITTNAELEQLKQKQQAEVEHQRALNALEIKRARDLATIEAKKFQSIVNAIGADTIKAMAEAGPAHQAELLKSLGLQSFLITDGNSPINLFNTAQGLIDPSAQQK